MKKYTEWMETRLKKLNWYDIPLIKLTVIFFTLFVITVWGGFRDLVLSVAWYWYLIITVILLVPLTRKLFFGK